MSGDGQTFVIIGASLAGAKAAETLRKEGFTGRLVLVGDETARPYERPPLSKDYLLGKKPRDKAFVHEAGWYTENDVELLLGVRATAVNPGARTVTIDGVEPLHYDKLLLATGSHVRRLEIPGSDLTGVRYLRTILESDALKEELREGRQVVVIGAGWIGLEVAAAARKHGATVTVVEVDSLPLRRVLGDELATIYADLHRAHGVQFRFNVGVREFGGAGGRLTHVVLEDGTELPADVAVVGVGIRPAVELAESAGLDVDNGIITDAQLRTSNPDIFAAGDVANSYHPVLERPVRVEHWANAQNGGKAVALSMLGRDDVYDKLPYFYSDQYDLGMEYSGYVGPEGYDAVVFRGDPSIVDGKAPEFLAFWVSRDDHVLAGMNANVWDVVKPIQNLIRAKRPIDRARLADPSVPLEDLLS